MYHRHRRLACLALLTLVVVPSLALATEREDLVQKLRERGVGRVERERTGQPVDLAKLEGWDIVLDGDASPAERHAAEELQALCEQATGVRLPIVTATDRAERHVFVGVSDAMRASAVGFDAKDLGEEGLRIVIADTAIALAGGPPRGTLYAVYAFAEEHLGVRFLTAAHTHVPPVGKTRPVGPLDVTYRPPLEFRSSYYGENGANPAFAVRLRLNANVRVPDEMGGTTRYHLINHSFQNLIPTRVYGKEHPEWYALRDGVRRWDVNGRDWAGDGTELCCTNEEAVATLTANTLKMLEKHPEWRNISVSQNDNDLNCLCDRCREVDEREGSSMGSLLSAVNTVAAAVAQTHPDVMVGTLAYKFSRRPPRTVRPRPNVQIQLCTFELSVFHPLDDPNSARNRPVYSDIQDWAKICDHIYVWHYVVNFGNYLIPTANLYHLDRDLRTFVAHNARGVMTQAAWNAVGGEFSDLRNYMIARLLWDPTLDGRALLDEFLDLHYGPAAGPVREFIAFMHAHAADSGAEPRCNGLARTYAINSAYAAEALKAFAKAKDACKGDAELLARVDKLSIVAYASALAAEIEPLLPPDVHRRSLPDIAREVLPKLTPDRRDRLQPLVTEFSRICETHGITMVNEGMTYAQWKTVMGLLLGGKAQE